MPGLWRRHRQRVIKLVASDKRRELFLSVLRRWHRSHLFRLVGAVMVAWVIGAVGIHLVEQGDNPSFDTWAESFYSVWVLLFSGLDEPPKSPLGRLFAMILLGTGVGLAGLFTGTVASVLV